MSDKNINPKITDDKNTNENTSKTPEKGRFSNYLHSMARNCCRTIKRGFRHYVNGIGFVDSQRLTE